MKRTLLLTALLCLLCGLAGAEYIMTEEEMLAVYQASFDKMNTTCELDIRTLADLPAFEEEYRAHTGRERKEDLLFNSLPMEGDMPYEEALAYARKLILDTFGTPEEELDAMGVYPTLTDYVYMDNESEWHFYFTPRRDTDIMLDHTYDGEGEYRVNFGAQTGKVDYCNWYIDAFWPEYAQRTWDSGRHEYVMSRAKHKEFFTQSPESQQHFLELFEEAGYPPEDFTMSEAELLRANSTEISFAPAEENLLSKDYAGVQAALEALEKETGLTAELLERNAFCLIRSPIELETQDYCVGFNYNVQEQLDAQGRLDWAQMEAMHHVKRVGQYLIRLDPETLELISIVHASLNEEKPDVSDAKLLQKSRWKGAELAEFEQLCQELRSLLETLEPMTEREMDGHMDTFMREWGGDAERYPLRRAQDMPLSEAEAAAIAREAGAKATGRTIEDFQSYYEPESIYFDAVDTYYVRYAPRNWRTNDAAESVTVPVNAKDGSVGEISLTHGFG